MFRTFLQPSDRSFPEYPRSTMGVVEDLIEKAKARAARASAKINGSSVERLGPKIITYIINCV